MRGTFWDGGGHAEGKEVEGAAKRGRRGGRRERGMGRGREGEKTRHKVCRRLRPWEEQHLSWGGGMGGVGQGGGRGRRGRPHMHGGAAGDVRLLSVRGGRGEGRRRREEEGGLTGATAEVIEGVMYSLVVCWESFLPNICRGQRGTSETLELPVACATRAGSGPVGDVSWMTVWCIAHLDDPTISTADKRRWGPMLPHSEMEREEARYLLGVRRGAVCTLMLSNPATVNSSHLLIPYSRNEESRLLTASLES